MYRVDRRSFNVNEPIEPQESSYQESETFNLDKQKLEKILTEELPEKREANRMTGLYIFAELSDAIRFCCRMSNSKIYKVAPFEDTTCYHRGDMNWTEIMNKFLDNEQPLREMARLYWQGRKTFKPCWEMLVNKVQVTEIIIDGNQSRNDLYKAYNETSGNVEKINFYIYTLNQHRPVE